MHSHKGSKWEGVAKFFTDHPSVLERYRYILIPDDDLDASCSDFNQFFRVVSLLNFTISQPSLTEDSPHSWAITLRHPQHVARQVSFVEIMTPCFDVRHLRFFLPTFSLNSSGHGLEWLWEKIAIENSVYNFGIVDEVSFRHTRAVGSAGSGGASCPTEEESARLLRHHTLVAKKPQNLNFFQRDKSGAMRMASPIQRQLWFLVHRLSRSPVLRRLRALAT